MWTYKAVVNRVVDADTLDLEVDLGFRVEIGLRLRLLNVNAPELTTKEGHTAKQFVEHICPAGTVVTIKSERDKKSFDRWLASVTLPDGSDLGERLKGEGLAE